jgi:hypothetical protein
MTKKIYKSIIVIIIFIINIVLANTSYAIILNNMPTSNDSVQPVPKDIIDNMNTSSYFDIEPYKKGNNAVYIATYNLSPEEYLLSAANKANNKDTDSDGLPDWQEILYGTDPKKADTDGDGTNDANEIKSGRDPLKENTAPIGQEFDDKITPEIIANNNQTNGERSQQDSTDKTVHDLISDVLASQPTSGEMSQEQIDYLINNPLKDTTQEKYSGTTEESDLNFIEETPENLLTYSNNYKTETEKLNQLLIRDNAIINSEATSEKEVRKKTEKITEIMLAYRTISNNLIKMPVPGNIGSSISINHLKLINNLERLIEIDNHILGSMEDITFYIPDLANYQVTITELTNIVSNIEGNTQNLSQKNITQDSTPNKTGSRVIWYFSILIILLAVYTAYKKRLKK